MCDTLTYKYTKYKVLKNCKKHINVKEVWIVRVVMEVRVID